MLRGREVVDVYTVSLEKSKRPLLISVFLIVEIYTYYSSSVFISALLSAAIFGNVSSIMLRVYQGTDEYHEKVQSIKEFINFHHLPKSLANRLQESFQHAWTYTNGIDMNAVSCLTI